MLELISKLGSFRYREWSNLEAAVAAAPAEAVVIQAVHSDSSTPAVEISSFETGGALVIAGVPHTVPRLMFEVWNDYLWLQHDQRLFRIGCEPWAVDWIEFDAPLMTMRVFDHLQILAAVSEDEVVLLNGSMDRVGGRTTDLIEDWSWLPDGVWVQQADEGSMSIFFRDLI